MTTIAVVGATGTAGFHVTARLKGREVGVVEISRASGVDLVTGQGLDGALAGVDVVIDVSNPLPADGDADIADTLGSAYRNLVGACASQEIQRLVISTIAGIDDPAFDGFPYFEAKRAADGVVVAQDWLIQPIAADTVADVLVAAALGQTHAPRTITGPDVIESDRSAQRLSGDSQRGRRGRCVQ